MSTTKINPPLEVLSSLRQPLTEGEKIALDFFSENLTSDWEIYVQPHLNGLRPDFVLLSPRKGIAVYEVKDWDLSAMRYFYKNVPGRVPMLFGDDGRKQFSLEKINPVERINLYREEVFNLYCPRLPKKLNTRESMRILPGLSPLPLAGEEGVRGSTSEAPTAPA